MPQPPLYLSVINNKPRTFSANKYKTTAGRIFHLNETQLNRYRLCGLTNPYVLDKGII